VQPKEVILELLAVLFPCHAIDTWRRVPVKTPVRLAKAVDGDVMQEC
jgi:hypothetical protein